MSAAGEAGFTLIEALVTLAVAALIAGIAFPAVERGQRHAQALATRNGVVLALREVRTGAIRTGRTALLRPARDGRELIADGVVVREMPAGMTVSSPAGVTFFPDGTTGGGEIAIAGAGRTERLLVSAPFGRIDTAP